MHSAAALDISMKRYQAGSGSYLAVLDNQRGLFDIREELVRAETASYIHVIALYKALGWGTGGDVAATRAARVESAVLPGPSAPY